MLKKYGRYYADWLDASGARKRQSFPTKKRALAHQSKMRAESSAKKAQPSAQSRTSRKRGPRRKGIARPTSLQPTSSASTAQ